MKPQTQSRQAWRRPPLRAAVIDPLRDSAAVVAASARVVPPEAVRLTCGPAQLGYIVDRPRQWTGVATQIVREVQDIIRLRYGGPCDCDDGEPYLVLVANALAQKVWGDNACRPNPLEPVRHRIKSWATKWVPQIAIVEVDRIVERAIAAPRRWRADSAAKLLQLTMAERTKINGTQIGAIDCDKAARTEIRKQKKRDAQRARDTARRRTNKKKTRAEYEASSFSARCRAADISRTTGYKWERQGRRF